MKKIKIIDGKFTLRGKAVEPKILELTILECLGVWGKKSLATYIANCARKEANAYTVGEMTCGYLPEGIRSYHPVLYLKIKEK